MKLSDYYDLESLRRTSEELVFDRVGRLLDERSDICHCEQCVLDLVAYVLNNVSPAYGTSLLGSLDPNQTRERRIKGEIEVALRDGIKRISENPTHDV
jgi:competence protein ComFB